MRGARPARVFFAALLAAISAWAGTACTHDFEAFEPRPVTEDDATADAPIARRDGASGEAATGVDAQVDAGCAPAATCVTTGDTCNDACNADQATCASKCGGGTSGRFCVYRCDSDRDRCKSTCHSTCRKCATALCDDACH